MQRNSLALTIYTPTLMLAFCRGMLIPVLPLYAASFDVSYGLVGLAVGSVGLGTIMGDLPAGVLLGRISAKRTMQLGIACIAVAMLAVGLTRTFPALVIFYFMSGLGTALYNISRHMYLTNETPLGQRGRAIAMFGGINRIGTFAGPVIGGSIGMAFGLRTPFLIFASVAAVAILFPTLFANDNRPSRLEHDGQAMSVVHHLQLMWQIFVEHIRVLMSAGLGQLFAQTIRSGRQIVIPLYASEILGLDVQAVGWIVSASAFVDMSLFYPAGWIMDRFGRKFAYVPSFILQGVGMALIPFTGSFAALLGATCLIGFGNGLGSGTMMTLGSDLAPADSRGEFLGIWRLIGDGGQTGGPIAVGAVADLFSLPIAIFVIASAGFMAALTLGLAVPETLHRAKTEPVRAAAD